MSRIHSISFINDSIFLKQTKTARPKPVCLWTVIDVLKWYRRHCNEYPQYCELFQQVNILNVKHSVFSVFHNFRNYFSMKLVEELFFD